MVILFLLTLAGASSVLIYGVKRRSNILIALGAVSSFAVLLIGFVLYSAYTLFPPPTTNLRQYNKLMRKAGSGPLVAHFPRTVPGEAQHPRFYFDPGMLQGATMLQLRYATTPARIAALQAQFAPKAKLSFRGGGDDTGAIHSPYFTTGGSPRKREVTEFPSDYTIYVLYQQYPPDHWNHNAFSGIAISNKRHEIVYWMEDW